VTSGAHTSRLVWVLRAAAPGGILRAALSCVSLWRVGVWDERISRSAWPRRPARSDGDEVACVLGDARAGGVAGGDHARLRESFRPAPPAGSGGRRGRSPRTVTDRACPMRGSRVFARRLSPEAIAYGLTWVLRETRSARMFTRLFVSRR
jgi:hypothetical protein